jgi:hypothetical protein
MDYPITRLLCVASLCSLVACDKTARLVPQLDAGSAAIATTPDAGNAPPATGNVPPASIPDGGSSGLDGGAAAPPFQISNRALVQWKRHAAFEADLMAALQLSREQLCVELGGKNCIREVHLVPLGGNEPYESGLMKPSSEPLATTSSVVDRVLLSACNARARLDAQAAPQVFTALDFKAALPAANDPAIATTVRDLYQRLLARDPAPREIEIVAGLAESAGEAALSTRDFAVLSCFMIGSTTEFLFF